MATITKFGKVGEKFADKEIDFLADQIKVFFLKSSYTPNFDTHEYQTSLDLANNEIGTTSTYTKGTGLVLANKTGTYIDGSDYTSFDADDLTVEDATIPDFRYAAIVDTQSANEATNPLIALIDYESTVALVAQQLKLKWNASGIFAI